MDTFFLIPRSIADACTVTTFFGIPPWYEYLIKSGALKSTDSGCIININFINQTTHKLDLSVLTLAGLGIFDILLRVAGLVAVGYVIYGGFQYQTSQGEPEKVRHAQGTIINALVGVAIVIIAASVVAFIGNRLSS